MKTLLTIAKALKFIAGILIAVIFCFIGGFFAIWLLIYLMGIW
jgi:hypothetical protein